MSDTAAETLAGTPEGDTGLAYYEEGDAYVGGRFVPAAEASVSIFDHSFLYGDGAFESVLCRNGVCFAMAEHLDRLWASCHVLQIEIPLTREEMIAVVDELIERNDARDGYVRIVVSRGKGYPLCDPREATEPLLAISTQRERAASVEDTRGLRLIVASTRRTPNVSLSPKVKSNNYLNHILAKLEAASAGADDAVMLDAEGYVAEVTTRNIFAVRGRRLLTPDPLNILEGVTRSTLMGLAADVPELDSVEECHLTAYDLYTADEVFVCGTGTGVNFVAEIDGRRIGDGTEGPVSRALRDSYERVLCQLGCAPSDARTHS